MDQLDRIEAKLEKLDSRQDGMDITLVRQQGVLDEHIRRSVANETALDILKTEQAEFRNFLKERAILWSVIGRVVTGVSAGAGVLGALWKALTVLGILK